MDNLAGAATKSECAVAQENEILKKKSGDDREDSLDIGMKQELADGEQSPQERIVSIINRDEDQRHCRVES